MVTKYIQDQGLSVLLEPVKNVISVSVGLWIKTGSRDERSDQYGYAHFVEHMLFKGTKNYSAKDIAREIDRVGGQHNAATNREYTCYYINVVSDHLELAIKILADMYNYSLFDTVELKKEKNVIIEEIRMYDDMPDEFIHDLFMENMQYGNALSHSILGTIEGIENTKQSDLLEFYDHHYNDDNCIFIITGDFDENHGKDLIAKYFNKRNKKIERSQTLVDHSKRKELLHVEKNLEQMHFCLGTDGLKNNDPDKWIFFAMSTILGGSMSSRLFQNIREDKGISYSIYSFHSSFNDNGLFGIYAAVSPENFNEAVDLILKECRDLYKKGVSKEELEDAKTYMIGNIALSVESMEVRMGQLAKNEMIYGKYVSFDEIINEINKVTLDDFNLITEKIFKDKKLSIVSIGKLLSGKLDDLNLVL